MNALPDIPHEVRPSVSRETLWRLAVFADAAQEWNTRFNLFASVPVDQFWTRHIWDSWQFTKAIPAATACVVDIGSGAGFPGLVIAIVTGLPVVLVESNGRKAAFLMEAGRRVGADVQVRQQRAETIALAAEVVTARALAPLVRLLALAFPLLTPDGRGVFAKGLTVDGEIAEARRYWDMTISRIPSITSPEGVLLVIDHLRPRREPRQTRHLHR